jgi:hypothetical protein
MPTKKSDRSPTINRFVGFIDIIGFKDLVARLEHQQVYTKLKKVYSAFKSESIDDPAYSVIGTKLYIFSDSIILFSNNDTINEMKELLRNMRVLMEDFWSIQFRLGVLLHTGKSLWTKRIRSFLASL